TIDAHVERIFLDAGTGERGLVHERQVREVEQVIDDKLIVRFDMAQRPGCGPGRAAILGKIRDQRPIGAERLTHPDVDETGALRRRKAPHAKSRRDLLLCRNMGTRAHAVEPQPVVAAFDVIVDELAPRELIETVRTAIIEHRDGIVAAPEHDERFVADRARQGGAADLAAEGRDIPLLKRKGRCRHPGLPWLLQLLNALSEIRYHVSFASITTRPRAPSWLRFRAGPRI